MGYLSGLFLDPGLWSKSLSRPDLGLEIQVIWSTLAILDFWKSNMHKYVCVLYIFIEMIGLGAIWHGLRPTIFRIRQSWT